MKPPAGFGIRLYLVLYQLYAEQNNVYATGSFDYDGVTVEFDTRKPIPSCAEIVKRYGKTQSEIEQELE